MGVGENYFKKQICSLGVLVGLGCREGGRESKTERDSEGEREKP